MTRVMHVIDSLEIGGAQRIVKGVMENQPKDDAHFLLALRQGSHCMAVDHPGVHVHDSSSRFPPGPLWTMGKLVQELDIQVLVCHLLRSQLYGWILKRWRFPGVRLIFLMHGPLPEFERRRSLATGVCTWLMRRSGIDLLVTPSRTLRDWLTSTFGLDPRRVRMLENFVDPALRPRSGSHAATRPPGREFQVGFAGRIEEVKGWRDFLAVADILSAREKGWVFAMAGAGSQDQACDRYLSQSGLGQRVRRMGVVEDMTRFYQHMDCLVVPSRFEGACLVAMEAMSWGIPVVAYDVPGLNDIIVHGQNGLLAPAGDVRGLAESVHRALEDESLRQRLSSQGLARAASFTVDAFVQGLSSEITALT